MTCKYYIFLFLPFLCFIITYQILVFLLGAQPVSMPSLVGKPVVQVISLLSSMDINIRTLPSHILSSTENDIPADIVIGQIPAPGVVVKQGHTVFITIAQKPPHARAPAIVGLYDQEIAKKMQDMGIKIKLYYLTSSQPADMCIAQLPEAGQELTDNTMIAYISAPKSPIVLFPNFKDQKFHVVQEFLEEYGIMYQVHRKDYSTHDHDCHDCVVYDQKPAPGILINSQKALTVHVYVAHNAHDTVY